MRSLSGRTPPGARYLELAHDETALAADLSQCKTEKRGRSIPTPVIGLPESVRPTSSYLTVKRRWT